MGLIGVCGFERRWEMGDGSVEGVGGVGSKE
jgi:hypothetical protein